MGFISCKSSCFVKSAPGEECHCRQFGQGWRWQEHGLCQPRHFSGQVGLQGGLLVTVESANLLYAYTTFLSDARERFTILNLVSLEVEVLTKGGRKLSGVLKDADS